jgi:uncharacterized protein
MKKRVFIVHGWGGSPKEGWFPYLKTELESRGFDVFAPKLPQSNKPKISNWVPALNSAVGIPDQNTYFVGHSIGCQAIARYLETLESDFRVGGAVFVAGFFKKLSISDWDDSDKNLSEEWLNTKIDLKKVKTILNQSVAIFSDDDPYVPLSNMQDFKDILGSKIIIENKKGHFSGSAGMTKLPVVMEAVLEIAGM